MAPQLGKLLYALVQAASKLKTILHRQHVGIKDKKSAIIINGHAISANNNISGQLDKVRIEAGTFTCVELHQGRLYAAKSAVPEVHVYRCEDDTHQIQQIFNVPRQEMKDANAWMNISVRRDRVTYSSTADNKIHIYSLTGNVLIADRDTDQLYVMNEKGEYAAVQLEPAVNHPRGAVMLNGDLFVASGIMELHKYNCQKS